MLEGDICVSPVLQQDHFTAAEVNLQGLGRVGVGGRSH